MTTGSEPMIMVGSAAPARKMAPRALVRWTAARHSGAAVRCRYLLRVRVTGKGMVADTKREVPFWVRNYDAAPGAEAPLIKVRDEESGGAAAVWCVARAC